MTEVEKRESARQFYQKWFGKGREDEDDRSYWIDIMSRIMGIENATDYIDFQKKVIVEGNTKRIDAYIPQTKVLIEQKSLGIPLDKKIHQSGGIELTPYEQAKRYNDNLPYDEKARWIVTSNFAEIWIYDMNMRVPEPVKITLADLQSKYSMLEFLINHETNEISQEVKISKDAGVIVGKLYNAFIKQYDNPEDPETLKSLNVLCVRIVFCLYAEDAGIFGIKNLFHTYMERFNAQTARKALRDLFKVLDQKESERDKYLKDDDPILASFPYVNGGLFENEDIEIPPFTDELLQTLLESSNFEWENISPTIFGAVFESTLNPDTRRSGGMHYTSIENIHKVIDPLFLDELKSEFEDLKNMKTRRKDGSINPIPYANKMQYLNAFQDKLAGLKFLDPACGSGNFLTESYLSIRRLENQVIKEKYEYQKDSLAGQISFTDNYQMNPIKVSISQFYGIEINDFAVTVAKAALWIAENQMMEETKNIIHTNINYLPLKTNAYIIEGNSLKIDWNDIVPKNELNYIMGNPPFVGYSLQSKEQKEDILSIYVNEEGNPYNTAGKIDYVAGWYFKAAQYMQGTSVRTALVSTNSITQGEQVAGVWKPLYERFGIHIDFAYRTFRWDSEATLKAHVHCVIVAFSTTPFHEKKKLFIDENEQIVENINAYLLDAPDIFVESQSKPICNVPYMTTGNRPADGGNLIIEDDDYQEFVRKEPTAQKYIKRLIGSAEFINNKKRWCLWLVGVEPGELRKMPMVMQRVEACKLDRENATDAGRRKLAETPTLFRETKNPRQYIVVPATSSERRRYIPIGFLDENTIPTNAVTIIPDATLYHFGIITSNVHMAWMRAVGGRLKSDYRYSKDIVYNNFPWPQPSDEQKKKIEETAKAILDARALYPNSSLADLYDEVAMPSELRKAHQQNDKAVMQAYGFSIKDTTENKCVSELMSLYQKYK